MKEAKKRFCFTTDDINKIEARAQLILKKTQPEKENSKINLNTVEVYKSGTFWLVILELEKPVTLAHVKNLFKEKEIGLERFLNLKNMVLLNRIFKKAPKNNSTIKTKPKYQRTVMTLEIKNDPLVLAAYIEAHSPENIWPQILTNMDTIGVIGMEIYLYKYQAFLIMDTTPNFNFEKDGERWANLPKEKEWQAHVAAFQKVNPESKAIEKWQIMTSIT